MIDIVTPEPEGWKENEEKKELWERENIKLRQKIIRLLDEFYDQRQTPPNPDAQLVLSDHGIYEAFRLQSKGAEALEEIPRDERITHQDKLMLYRQEMNAFMEFLKRKFFEQS